MILVSWGAKISKERKGGGGGGGKFQTFGNKLILNIPELQIQSKKKIGRVCQ